MKLRKQDCFGKVLIDSRNCMFSFGIGALDSVICVSRDKAISVVELCCDCILK